MASPPRREMIAADLRIGDMRGPQVVNLLLTTQIAYRATSLITSRTPVSVNRTVGVRRVGSAPDCSWCRYGLTRRRRSR